MNYLTLSRRLALIGLCLLPTAGWAADAVQVSDAWTRATPGQATSSAVYLTIVSAQADAVVAATTPIAAASLHLHQMLNGIGQMRAVERVAITAATPFHFAPMGYHIMVTGLKAPLKPGDHFPLTLNFEKAGPVTVAVTVRPLRESTPMTPMSGMDAMPGMSNMDMPK